MMTRLRKLLENWVARVLFVLLCLVFVFWGISNVVTLIGSSNAVAHVAGQPVDLAAVQSAYQKNLADASRGSATPPDQAMRAQLAMDALTRVVRDKVLEVEENRLGVVAPDNVLRQIVTSEPGFQTNGVFDQAKFNAVLQQNNTSPAQFLEMARRAIAADQILEAAAAGVRPPQLLTDRVFAFVTEQRTIEQVTIPAAAQPAPPLPGDAMLQRYWRNHPGLFTTPEYREVKIVILSPQTLAPGEVVTDAQLKAAYAQSYGASQSPPSRSVQVVSVSDAKAAAALAAQWQAGASWSAIQAQAAKAGGTAIQLDNATQSQIPSAALAGAVFGAAPGKIVGPVQGPDNYFVFNVTSASSGGAPPFALVADALRQKLQIQMAQARVNQDLDNVQDALAGQTPLDQLPGNLGLVAVEGTLDAKGNTPKGEPAPIPGGDALRKAIVQAVFAGHPGDAPQLMNGPDNSYFAFTIDTIQPPSLQPYDAVKQKVAAAWLQDAMQREAEVKAVALLQAVNKGQSLDSAASAAGYSLTALPAMTRTAPSAGVSNALAQILFSLKPGQATMQQSKDGFTVLAVTAITRPSPKDDPSDAAAVTQAMTKAMQDDTVASLMAGFQARDSVRVNGKVFAQIYQ